MTNKTSENKQLSGKLEFTARITMPDGRVIEKKIEADGGVPADGEMDFHTIDGFRLSFDRYEKAILQARDKACKELTDEYMKELSKKKKDNKK